MEPNYTMELLICWYCIISCTESKMSSREIVFVDRNWSYTCAISLFNINLVTFVPNVLLSCDRAALRKVLSFCTSIRLSVTPVIFTMFLSWDAHTISLEKRSIVKVTAVKTSFAPVRSDADGNFPANYRWQRKAGSNIEVLCYFCQDQ